MKYYLGAKLPDYCAAFLHYFDKITRCLVIFFPKAFYYHFFICNFANI